MLALIGFQRLHGSRAQRAINGNLVAFLLQRGLNRFDGFAVHAVITQHAFPTHLRIGDLLELGHFRIFGRNFLLALFGFFHQLLHLDRLVFGRHFDFAGGFLAHQFLLLHRLKLGFDLGRVQAGFFLHGLLGDGFHLRRDFHHAQRFASGGEGTRRAFAARGHVRRFGDHFFFDFGILRRHDFLRGHRRFDFNLLLDGFKDGGDDFQFLAGGLDHDLLFRPLVFGGNNLVGFGGILDDDLLGARLELGRNHDQRLAFARLHLRHGQGDAVGGGRGGRFLRLGGVVILCLSQSGNRHGSQQHRNLTFHHSKSPELRGFT